MDTGRKNNKTLKQLEYQTQIDGLRALAIIAVILYHYDIWCPGGFQGVDVFFVISGYLISSRMISGYTAIQKKFSMLTFWQGRIRRLFPAVVFLFVCFSIMGWLVSTKIGYMQLCKEMIFSLLGLVNFYFFMEQQDNGYFAPITQNYPLIHFWSLAVGIQFFIVLSIILFIITKVVRSNDKRFCSFAFLYLMIFIISLFLSIYLSPIYKNLSFYLIPTRAWEFATGCIVSILCNKQFQQRLQGINCCKKMMNSQKLALLRKLSFQLLGWSGIALILFAYTGVGEQNFDFPGSITLIPCIGTALFLIGNKIRNQEKENQQTTRIRTTSARIFSLQPLAYIGQISYSIYLWYWIIQSFEFMYFSDGNITSTRKALLFIFTIGIATFSTVVIQAIFRDPKKVSRRTIWIGFIASSIILLSYLLASYYEGFHRQIGGQNGALGVNNQNVYDVNKKQHFDQDGIFMANPYASIEHIDADIVRQSYSQSYRYQLYKIEGVRIFNNKKGVKPKIAVYGSSYAQMNHKTFQSLSKQFDIPLGYISIGAPRSIFADPMTSFNQKAIKQLLDWDLDLLIYFEYFQKYYYKDIHGMAKRHLDLLFSTNPKKIIVFGAIPTFDIKSYSTVRQYFVKESKHNEKYDFITKLKPKTYEGYTITTGEAEIQKVIKENYADKDIQFYPLRQFFLDVDGNVQVLGSQTFGLSLYLDGVHLNQLGSLRLKNYLRKKVFGQFIKPIR